MGIFGPKKPLLGGYDQNAAMMGQSGFASAPPPPQGNPMAALGGYDRAAAMQGQSGFAPMNVGFTPPAAEKKKGPNWAGIAADFLAGMAGQPGQFAAQQQHERAMQQRQQRQRQQEREDFIWKSQYERDNPKPVNNDTVNDLNWYKNLSEEDRKLYHQMKPVVGYMADGTPRIINPMEVGQPNRGPKPGTIEDGHEFIGGNPADPKSWRKVGGQPAGASPFVQ